MNRNRIVSELIEYNGYSYNQAIKIIENRKVIYKSCFREKNIGGRQVVDSTTLTDDNKLLLNYYKEIIQNVYDVKFPNRNQIMKEFMNIIPFLSNYNDVSIYKFDIEKFFYNIDVIKVINKINDSSLLFPFEIDFLIKTIKQWKSFTPGIGLINCLTEMLGKDFDARIRSIYPHDLIYYSRYVDDCILVFSSKVDKTELVNIVNDELRSVFGENISTNPRKTDFFSETKNLNFEFLGYHIFSNRNNGHSELVFGLGKKKIEKNIEKLERIVRDYKKNNNKKLLITRLDLFYKRLVYRKKDLTSSKVNWEVRGISQNYEELRRFIQRESTSRRYETGNLTKDTKNLINGTCLRQIFSNNRIDIPHEIDQSIKSNHYIKNFYENRAVILNKEIGYTYPHLTKVLSRVGIKVSSATNYSDLCKIYYDEIYCIK